MLRKQIIRENTHETKGFVSRIFIVKKSDGGKRLILEWKSWMNFPNMKILEWMVLKPL